MDIALTDSLEQMFISQKALLEKYKIIENLPAYPIELDSRKGQALIRDFIGRYVEELSEAFEQAAFGALDIEKNSQTSARGCIRNFNEEIADSNHFLLEILIYSNITFQDIDNMCKSRMFESGMGNLYLSGNPIQSLLRVGRFRNSQLDIPNKSQLFQVFTDMDVIKDSTLCGGKRISSIMINTYAMFLWWITHSLNTARALLKNKDWTNTDRKVNEIGYREKLFDTLTIIFQFYDLIEMTELSLFTSYMKKNNLNQERIKNKY